MTLFFLGWLVCLTVLVGAKLGATSPKTAPGTTETWKITYPTGSTMQSAVFLDNNRTEEIMKEKKDVNMNDLIV